MAIKYVIMNVQTLSYRCTIVILSFLVAQQMYALCAISGQIIDVHEEPVAFANILLFRQDSTLAKGGITDENGFFLIEEVVEGQYKLAISMIGYKTTYHELFVTAVKSSISLDIIRLEEEAFQLGAVEISAKKPLFVQEIDRLVINVENSITTATGSVLDVLEKSPGVRVNRQSNSMALNGKNGVVIMLNGKESRMPLEAAIQLLQSMPATQVEKIELITTPPAKYDAEGNAGFINIVYKKSDAYGTNGSMNLRIGYGTYEKYGGNLLFNHRTARINFYGSYSYLFDHSFELVNNTRSILFNGLETTVNSAPDRQIFKTNQLANLGIDLAVSDNTFIGLLISGYNDKWTNGEDAFNAIQVTENNALTTNMNLYNQEYRNWQHLMGNINAEHTISRGQTLSFNLDYLYYKNNNPTDLFNEIEDVQNNIFNQENIRVRKETPLGIWVAKSDYSRKINDQLQLDAGLKITLSQFENDIRVEKQMMDDWESDMNFTQFTALEEKVYAAYSSFRYDFHEKISLSGGLRYELTALSLKKQGLQDDFSRRFGNFFPTFLFSYEINENQSLQFNFNRRISRPTFNDLAPQVILLDPFSFITGNPQLQPAISNTVKADYRFNAILISMGYTHESEAIVTYQPTINAEDNIQIYAAQNLDYLKTWNTMLSFPLYLTKWWEVQTNISVLSQKLKTGGENPPISINQFNYNFNMMHSFQLPQKISLELSGAYQSRTLWGYMIMQPIGSVNAGIQKIFKDHSKLRFSCMDVFDTYDWEFITNVPELNLRSSFAVNWEGQKFMLSYSRNFGNHKMKSTRKWDTGSVEESRRVAN